MLWIPGKKTLSKGAVGLPREIGSGRKQRSDVEIPQAIWWVTEVCEKSGESITSLNRRFGNTNESVDWFRFHTGRRTPSLGMVERVEKDISDTQRVFLHPLWKLLKAEDLATESILKIYPTLPENVRLFLMDKGKKWPMAQFSFEQDQIKNLFQMPILDALAALLFLESYARAIRGKKLEGRVRKAFVRMAPSIYWLPTMREKFVRLDILRTTQIPLNPNKFPNPSNISGHVKVPVTDILLAMLKEKLDTRLELRATLAIPVTFDWRFALALYDKNGNLRRGVTDEQISEEIERSYRESI